MTENDQNVQYSNVDECRNQSSTNILKNIQINSDQQTGSHVKTKDNPASEESNRQSGFVGEMISQINSSGKEEKSPINSDQKLASSNVQQNSSVQKSKNDLKKLDNDMTAAKPGFPVKVGSQSMNSSSIRDIPPDLPKKEKNIKALQNAAMPSDANKASSAVGSQNSNKDFKRLPNEKNNSVSVATHKDHLRHTASMSEHSKMTQNKVAMENSKNMRMDIANSPSHGSNPKNSKSEIVQKTDNPESSKQCSSDKRFQKVLPPIDKTFSLKPCSARRSSNTTDNSENSDDTSRVQVPQKNDKTVDSFPPSIPPKVNAHQTNIPPVDKNPGDPPMIPPKKSNLASKGIHHPQAPKENATNKDVAAKLPPENIATVKPVQVVEQRAVKHDESVQKLNVDVVEVKDANNEKNVQLQKGNMPDLISKILPDEKNELILIEETKIEKNGKNEKNDTTNNKNYLANTEQSIHENEITDSPKSPKRQSWFFGTHKNSMVVSVIFYLFQLVP